MRTPWVFETMGTVVSLRADADAAAIDRVRALFADADARFDLGSRRTVRGDRRDCFIQSFRRYLPLAEPGDADSGSCARTTAIGQGGLQRMSRLTEPTKNRSTALRA
ncbi:hypothetical protein SAMN05216219_1126 [Mycetocola miduiensis]|uniref:FAD:protein FMN transferase n=1 Tax=Mycetocola miduiensis TaxID=995034 RepID=A0A1I4ZVZ0_9MICO|nr:hypothetical protein SAMN05216219_1126 [Mycetocola miduiensis]